VDGANATDTAVWLQALLAAVPAYVWRVDADLKIRFISRAPRGLDGSAFVGRAASGFSLAEDRSRLEAAMVDVLASGLATRLDVRSNLPEAGEVFSVHVAPVEIAGGRELCLTMRAVDEERHTISELRRATSRLSMAMASTDLAWWEADLESGEIIWSPEMHALTGEPVPLDHAGFTNKLVHPDDRAASEQRMVALAGEGAFKGETRLIVKGETKWVHVSGRLLVDEEGRRRMLGGMVDLTQERRLADQLWHAERMALIGELTAGVAHNFNNVLMALTPTLELIAADGDERSAELATSALTVTRRAATIVGQLMSVAGNSPTRPPEPIDLVPVVSESVDICRRMFPGHIALRLDASEVEDGAPLTPVVAVADEDRVTQVVMNLLLNARDAFGEGAGRCTDGEAPTVEVSVGDSAEAPDAFVVISVRDNGPGVPPELRERLFEPFVSSKGVAGTGLGLASCAAIAGQLGGSMRVDHPASGGVCFSLSLPRGSAASLGEVRRTTPSEGHRAAQTIDGARVLIVEDEPVIREAVATILRRRGAEVVATASVPATLSALEAGDLAIDVVLLDRSLPGISGVELLPNLRAELPDAAILFFTGEPVPESEVDLVEGVISKPIRARDLVARLVEVLSPESK